METTSVFRNPAVGAMRALAIGWLDKVQWRHHGIGVLQGYVREGDEPEVRLHIWSPKLLKPGMDQSGDIHDHRFDMTSHVLSGVVEHEEIVETSDPNGTHATMALTHARAAAGTQYHGPTTAIEGRYTIKSAKCIIDEGWSYTFKAGFFHRSPISNLPRDIVAVTCVEKRNQVETPARILYPVSREPVMAFGHRPDKALIKEVVELARHQLGWAR